MNSLICSGPNLTLDFDCNAVLDFQPDSTRVLIGKLITNVKDYSKFKLNLLSQRQLNSNNNTNNSIFYQFSGLEEKGIRITDKECWGKIIDFFIDINLKKIYDSVRSSFCLASILFI